MSYSSRDLHIKRDIASGLYVPTKLEICIGTADFKIMCILQRAALEFMKMYGDSFEYDVTYSPDKECFIYSDGVGVIDYFDGVILYYGKKYKLPTDDYKYFNLCENDEERVIDPTSKYYYMIDHYDTGDEPYVANVYHQKNMTEEVMMDKYSVFATVQLLIEKGIIKK